MKCRIVLLALLTLLISCFSCAAEDYYSDFLIKDSQGGSIVAGYTGNESHITVPGIAVSESGGEWPIDCISDSAFEGCETIRSIVISEGIRYIYPNAFKDCINLETVILPESLEKIHDFAFSGCKNLTSVVLPHNLYEVAETAFEGCENLVFTPDQLDILNNTEVIRQAAFTADTENLVELTDVLYDLDYKTDAVVEYFGDLKLLLEGCNTSYSNYHFDVCSYTGDIIEELTLFGKANYSIHGIYPTMSVNSAMELMEKTGWTPTDIVVSIEGGPAEYKNAMGDLLRFGWDMQSKITNISLTINLQAHLGGTTQTQVTSFIFKYDFDTDPLMVPAGTSLTCTGIHSTDDQGYRWEYVTYMDANGWILSDHIEVPQKRR